MVNTFSLASGGTILHNGGGSGIGPPSQGRPGRVSEMLAICAEGMTNPEPSTSFKRLINAFKIAKLRGW
jgi:hypothetical protein